MRVNLDGLRRSHLVAWLVTSGIVLSVSGVGQTGAPPRTSADRFSTAGIRLDRPAGFQLSESFEGYAQPGTASSVMVLRIPGPFKEVTGGLSAENLKSRGMTLVNRADLTVDGLPGMLFNIRQMAASTTFEKWISAFGDSGQTFIVTAAFPASQAEKLSALLRSTVLSARRDGNPSTVADVPFSISPAGGLMPAPSMGKSLAFTEGGRSPVTSAEEPLFIAARSLGTVKPLNQRQYARQRLVLSEGLKNLEVTGQSPVQVDGLAGFESTASAIDAKTGTPILAYQVMLFDSEGYVLMQGLVGKRKAAEFEPIFKSMARSFKRVGPQVRNPEHPERSRPGA